MDTETIIPEIYKESLDEIILDYLEAELEGYLDYLEAEIKRYLDNLINDAFSWNWRGLTK